MTSPDGIYEKSKPGHRGFEFVPLKVPRRAPMKYARQTPAALPEVTELDVIRHFSQLSTRNHSQVMGPQFPALDAKFVSPQHEKHAGLFQCLHPEAPLQTVQGAIEVIALFEKAICELSGLDECSVQPLGSPSALAGLLVVRAFHEHHGSSRKFVLVPQAQIETYRKSCALAGYIPLPVTPSKNGLFVPEDLVSIIEEYGREISAFLLPNPNLEGEFETGVRYLAELIHGIGAQLFIDGIHFGSILGSAKPRDMGADLLQVDLGRTFGGHRGGQQSETAFAGPIAVRAHLSAYLPSPRVQKSGKYFVWEPATQSVGKVTGFYGDFKGVAMALSILLSQGSAGLIQSGQAGVLATHYFKHQLKTIPFPLGASNAMLAQLSESESIQDLDQLLIQTLMRTRTIEEKFGNASPQTAIPKMDEIGATRLPILSLDDRAR